MKNNILQSPFEVIIVLITFLSLIFLPIIQAQDSLPKNHSTRIEIPIKPLSSSLPEDLTIPIRFSGETMTLALKKTRVFGKNTRFLIDDGTGKLMETTMGQDRSYQGTIVEHPNYTISAVLTNNGLIATI